MEQINNHDLKIKNNFCKMWITKLFIWEKILWKKLYNSFLTEQLEFDMHFFDKYINNILYNIFNKNIIWIRPSNLNLISEKHIIDVISKDWNLDNDIYTLWDDLSLIFEQNLIFNNPKIDLENFIDVDAIKKVKNWMKEYLDFLYNNWVYAPLIYKTLDDIVKKTIDVLNNTK